MNLPKLIMKFGGTSVKDPATIRAAASLVIAAGDRKPLVVVSAAGGVTNSLAKILDLAVTGAGSEKLDALLEQLIERHRGMLADFELAPTLLDLRFAELRDLVHGIGLLREVTPRTWDLVLSYGEFMLAPIFAAHLQQRGVTAKAWSAGDLGMITDDRFNRARPLAQAYEMIPQSLAASPQHIAVVTGFAGRTVSGEATTLGRGGSDYSASIIAKAVQAEELQIWTDVDGILTADPRLIPQARLIDTLGFREASELAFSGAKVLHPQTITPALEGNIPVRVLNSMRAQHPGTLIVADEQLDGGAVVRSIAHKVGVNVITIISPRMVARPGFITRISAVFENFGISIDMISTSEVSVSLTTDEQPSHLEALLDALRGFSEVQVGVNRGMVSIVGGRLGETITLFGRVFNTLAECGTRPEMISYGATRMNLSMIVPASEVPKVVAALHREYFEQDVDL